MELYKCKCEHESHTKKDKLSPNGNSGHRYNAAFAYNYTKYIKTPYATFHVCLDCANDCLQDYNNTNQNKELKD